MIKLLIDECLSAELVLMARERGHHESSHVVWIGKSGWKDWELKKVLLDEDWVLVTWNCKDFRGPKNAVGSKGVLADVPLHAGQSRRPTDLAEAPMGTADWSTTLTDKKPRRLSLFEKCVPPRLIRGQRFYRCGMERDNTRLAELAFTDRYQSLGKVHVAVCEPNRFAAAHAGRGE